jgi:hypothetical protein
LWTLLPLILNRGWKGSPCKVFTFLFHALSESNTQLKPLTNERRRHVKPRAYIGSELE